MILFSLPTKSSSNKHENALDLGKLRNQIPNALADAASVAEATEAGHDSKNFLLALSYLNALWELNGARVSIHPQHGRPT